MSLLLAAATEAEIAPTLDWITSLDNVHPLREHLRICITGVGIMATTYSVTYELARQKADLVVVAGIAGAFDKSLCLGECVVVKSEQFGDFGAEDGDKFLNAFDMGLANANEAPFKQGKLQNPLTSLPEVWSHLRRVSSLTVQRVSGHEPTIEQRARLYAADIESMEGAALHYVCGRLGVPYVQLRSISNYVTKRDRSSWKLPEAISALNTQLQEWLQGLH